MPGPIFTTGDRIALRSIETEDAQWLAELFNDPRVWPRTGMVDPKSLEDEREWIESLSENNKIQFVVTVDETRVGTVGFKPPNERWGVAELAYTIDPEHWENGYATEAAETICAYGFETLRLNKIIAECFASNDASANVLEKVGFTQEGRFRDEAYVDGEYIDILRYGLLVDEF
ncbi:GNAT family N-acetyltransferase [Halocatena halophila]|uniref:GNAT family N-acetyltransferase n=1 Tax=Halocatena halophila TaxID=2814576 RepID=UPI002ED10094